MKIFNDQPSKTTILLLLIILSISELLIAQNDDDPITVGFYRNLYSEILNENRQLLIKLPKGYDETNLDYPVLFLLYADYKEQYFFEAVSNVYSLGNGVSTPQIILIGVGNVDRYRDLLPQHNDGSSTGIDNFVKFFENELIPYVNKNFRTKDFKILMGPQAGANFGLYTLFKTPDLFDAYIITNPFRWQGGRDILFENAKAYLAKNYSLKKFLYITYDDDDALERIGNSYIEQFAELIEEEKPLDFILKLNFIEEGYDFISPTGLKKGLKVLFEGYRLPEDHQLETLTHFKKYYGKLSEKYGFDVDIPELALTLQSDELIKENRIDEALEILLYNREHYPFKANAFWRLGEIYRKQGKNKEAVENFNEVLRLYPDMTPIKDLIEELESQEE